MVHQKITRVPITRVLITREPITRVQIRFYSNDIIMSDQKMLSDSK